MRLRDKVYPYPVIVEGGDYYNESSFVSKVSQSMDGYNVSINISVELKDQKMLEMIDAGEAIYAHHIECPQTCYRKMFLSKTNEFNVLLKDTDVNGKIQICSFVIANKDITKYTNESFSSLYKGWKFDIEKGCILAVGNQYDLIVSKQRDDLANTSSIFSIISNADPNANSISYDLSQNKIIISLPKESFGKFSTVQSLIEYQPIMHSMLIVPALIYTFYELKNSVDSLYEFEDRRWFRGLRKACIDIGEKFDEDSIKTMDAIRISQLLLDSPVIKAIDRCAKGDGFYED